MEHIEEAGVHSGDSACVIPPTTLRAPVLDGIEDHTRALASALDVRGLLNVQYAVKDGEVFVLEANPRASRTVPFVSKATNVQLAKLAARVMLGASLAGLGAEGLPIPGRGSGGHVAVKEAVLPFERFPEVDTVLGPEMRSTGEVMGVDRSFGLAFTKSQAAAGNRLPEGGTVLLSLADRDKPAGLIAARRLLELGFSLVATAGTAAALEAGGIPVDAVVDKLGNDHEPGMDAVDMISSGKVDLVINTPRGRGPRADGDHIRRTATAHRVSCVTTVAAAVAAASGLAEWATSEPQVRSLQEYHRDHQLRLEV
jgi:carbamoyl-phosphate synthase large subunit